MSRQSSVMSRLSSGYSAFHLFVVSGFSRTLAGR